MTRPGPVGVGAGVPSGTRTVESAPGASVGFASGGLVSVGLNSTGLPSTGLRSVTFAPDVPALDD
jgi:hypothetical protein